MALSKPSFLAHLRTLSKLHGHRRTHLFPSSITLRSLSFDSPEEAAAERRRRKRRLRIEPPLSSLGRLQQPPQPTQSKPIQNPNAPKIPEPVSALSGNRLNLHNKILTLIRQNDLEEAALFTRHSIYSNCRPTIYTVNAVLNAQLRQSKYSDLLSLHRFITQAGVAPNIITYNLIFQTYLDCRKPDTAMEHYKQFINDSPVNPSPTTYRILVKGLVENGKLERAVELLQDMSEKGMDADPFVYSYLMLGSARNGDADEIFRLYEELKDNKGGILDGGVVYGNLMKGYFIKGMEKEAMECYEEACGENLKVKMSAIAYNFVLDALSKNGKFDEALNLFDRMRNEHNPPRRLSVNLGSFNVIVDGYCAESRFKDAIEVFRMMGEYRCSPDTLSFNNLIDQLCKNDMLAEAEEIYGEMGEKGVNPDEYTYGLLMDTCFRVKRIDDGAAYFRKMVESGLRPNMAAYNRLVDELVKEGKIDEAKSFYDTMMKKLKMDDESYKFMMKAMSDAGRLDDVLKMVDGILEEGAEFSEELQEFVKEELAKEGRAEDLTKLMEEKERKKAEAKAKEIEAAEAAKRSARAAVSSLLPSKLFGNKEADTESTLASGDAADSASATTKKESVEEATVVESSSSSSTSSDSSLDESESENDDKVTS